MNFKLKFSDKTEQTATNICLSCRSHKKRTYANGRTEHLCGAFVEYFEVIPHPVSSCDVYDDGANEKLYQMQQMGWVMVKEMNGNWTFVHPVTMQKTQVVRVPRIPVPFWKRWWRKVSGYNRNQMALRSLVIDVPENDN